MATSNNDDIIIGGVKSFRGVFDEEISDGVEIEGFGGEGTEKFGCSKHRKWVKCFI